MVSLEIVSLRFNRMTKWKIKKEETNKQTKKRTVDKPKKKSFTKSVLFG